MLIYNGSIFIEYCKGDIEMTKSKPEKRRVLADFDMYDRQALEETLASQLEKGCKLTRAVQILGVMTFEPIAPEEKITYAVIRPTEYENGGTLPEPWHRCGRVGGFIVYSSTGAAYIPKPDADPAEWERKRKKNALVTGLLWLLLFVLYAVVDIPDMFGSARKFSENFDFKFIRDIVYAVCGFSWLGMGLSKKKVSRKKRGHFRLYILPWVIGLLLIGLVIFFMKLDLNKNIDIPMPDSRLPFSEETDQCTLTRSYTARRYVYDDTSEERYCKCFLYETKVPGLSEKLFEEIYDDWISDRFSSYPIPNRFISCDFERRDAGDYTALDEILFCREYEGMSGIIYQGVIVRSGDNIFGMGYSKGDFDNSEILLYLDDFFNGV